MNFKINTFADICVMMDLTPGEKYYVTIEACNVVFLCTEVSSDGIVPDNSPPIPGIIFVGDSNRHSAYLPHR